MSKHKKLFFALDFPDAKVALDFVDGNHIGSFAEGVKIGLELFIAAGPDFIRWMRARNLEVFLDLKLHDISETVARAVNAARAHKVRYLSIHASGGAAMLQKAQEMVRDTEMQLLAITVLTSMTDDDLHAIGFREPCKQSAIQLATLAQTAGIQGLVCSAHEAAALRALYPAATLVTPAIRLADGNADDQARIATPGLAIKNGADILVVGRPIRDAADPFAAAMRFRDEMDAAT